MPPLYATRTLGPQGAGDPNEIIRVENRAARRRKRRRLAEKLRNQPHLADNVREIRRTYPWLGPDVIRGLATQGQHAESPRTRQVADLAARRAARKGRWARPGEVERANPNLADVVGRTGIPGVRSTPRGVTREGGLGLGGVLGETAEFLDEQVSKIPGLGPDRRDSFARTEEAAAGIVGLDDELRGVSRGFMLGVQIPADLTVGAIRRAAAGISDASDYGVGPTFVAGAQDPFDVQGTGPGRTPIQAQSQGLQAAKALAEGRRVDVGSGWFPDFDSETGRAAAEAARQAAPNIGPHAFTLGRYIANQAFPVDSVGFDIISGATDAVIATKYDPANIPFGVWTQARRGGRVFAATDPDVLAAARRADAAVDLARRNPDDLDLAARAREAETTVRELSDTAVAAARREAGAFEGHRPWYSQRTAQQWFGTKGKPIVDWSTTNDDPYRSWLLWRDSQGKPRGPRDMHVDLAAAEDESEVMAVLGRYLGSEVREMPSTTPFRYDARPLDGQRWAQMAPKEAAINPARPEDAIVEADRYARNAGLGYEERAAAVRPFFTATSYDDYYDAVDGLLDAIRRKLVDGGDPEIAAAELTTFAAQRNRALRRYGVDDTSGENLDQPFALVGDDLVPTPSPHLPTEQLSQGIPLPDFRAVRRATRRLGGDAMRVRGRAQERVRRVAESLEGTDLAGRVARAAEADAFGAVSPHTGLGLSRQTRRGVMAPLAVVRKHAERLDGLAAEAKRLGRGDAARGLRSAARALRISAGDDWMKAATGGLLEGFGDLWRRSKLFRPAWGIRVVGEEQARLWAYGGVGLFDHPLQAVAIIAGTNPEGRLARALSRTPLKPALVADVKGASLGTADELTEAMNQSFGILYTDAIQRGVKGPSVDMWTVASRGETSYAQGLAEETARLAMDPIAKRVAGMTRDDARRFFTEDPDGVRLWETVARPGRLARPARGADAKDVADMTDVERSSLLDFYLDSVEARIQGLTQGDPRVRQAIATGKLGDTSLAVKDGQIDPGLADELLALDGYVGPGKVRVREVLTHPGAKGRLDALGQTFDTMMWNLMPRPSNELSRSPLFRQSYWQRVAELGDEMDPRALRKAIDGGERTVRSAGWAEPDGLAALRGARGTRGGLSIDEVDRLAKAHALQHTQATLYDLSERGQLFDALRQVFPFGEAWKEVLTRWGRAVYENPKVVHRLDQGLTSAREAGIITKDPTTGQEVVLYPGSEWITDKIIGVPVPLTGSVQGVNIASAGLPGVGPAVSLPLPYLAKALGWDLDDPGFTRDLMEAIYPFGRNDTGRLDRDILEQLLPTWGARLGKSVEGWVSGGEITDPSTRSTLNYFLNYLASTGDYHLHGEAGDDPLTETKRLIDDATAKTRLFMVFRAGASATAPSAPIPRYLFRDEDNKLAEMQVVRERYQKIASDPDRGEDEAFAWLIDTFGPDSFLVAQSFTRTNGLNLPRTREQADFVHERQWLRVQYPETYGLILPPDDPDDFDITEYFAQVRRGERENLTPKQRVEVANQRLANYIYDRAVSKLGDIDETDQARLDKLESLLKRDYPGYQKHGFDYQRTPNRIAEITRLVNDDRVNRDPKMAKAAEAVRLYLRGRDAVIEAQGAEGLTTRGISTAASNEERRKTLRRLAKAIREEVPRFGYFWDFVFSREVGKAPKPAKSEIMSGIRDPDAPPLVTTSAKKPSTPEEKVQAAAERWVIRDAHDRRRGQRGIKPPNPGEVIHGKGFDQIGHVRKRNGEWEYRSVIATPVFKEGEPGWDAKWSAGPWKPLPDMYVGKSPGGDVGARVPRQGPSGSTRRETAEERKRRERFGGAL